jgi:hypothetical protein
MTMHLVRGLSSINTKKRKKNKPVGWQKAEAAHEKWLMKRGIHPSQLKDKEKSSGNKIPSYKVHREVPTSDVICKIPGRKDANEYTGTYITGIAQMHKSNAVPVGRGTDPKIYAQMRRG